jgi:hypothetical protein
MVDKIPKIKIENSKLINRLESGVFTSYQKSGKSLKFEIEESNKGFLSLFGLFINTENFDVALGYFPDKTSYIRVSNAEEIFRRVHVISDKVKIDFLYLLQQLKVNLEECFKSPSVLCEEVKQVGFTCEGKSIVHNLIKYKDDTMEGESFSIDVNSLLRFIEKCLLLSVLLNYQALSVLHKFNIEESKEEELKILSKYCPDKLGGLYEHYGSGLSSTYEALNQIEGFDRLYLNSLYSYGYNITSRLARLRGLVQLIKSRNISKENVGYVCKSVSSCGIEGLEDGNKILSSNQILSYYNVFDVLSCLGVFDLVCSSIEEENDVVKILRAVHVYELIEDKFNYEEFIGAFNNYIEMVDRINQGMVYKRPINDKNKDLRCIQQVSLQNACRLMRCVL